MEFSGWPSWESGTAWTGNTGNDKEGRKIQFRESVLKDKIEKTRFDFYAIRGSGRKDRAIMTLRTRIKDQIVPITIEVVILAIGYFTFTKMPPMGTAGDIVAWFLLLVAFSVVFSFFPAIAIIYGWYTGNRNGAILVGALPFPLLFIFMFFLIRADNMVFIHVPGTMLFIVILSAICGLAGYCAAQRTKPFLAVSVILTGLWLFIWMSGFN